MSDKPWNRCWEIEEIVDNAHNWSLAGDAGLLKYLEKFSDNLLSKAEETNSNLNNLLNNLEHTGLKLDLAKNKFLSLQNTQFVESRVYEDDEIDETLEPSESVEESKKQDEVKVESLKTAVLKGIDVMNQFYDKVEVVASDSEDEDDNESPNFVLRPKDPYLDRPLPFIIGTEEWHKKWHVGLQDTSSDEGDSDKLSDNYSDDDSDLPLDENDLLNEEQQIKRPIANSTINDAIKDDILYSSDSEDHSYPSKPAISNGNFAQQLSKQLGNVLQEQESEGEVNKRPIMKANKTNTAYPTNIFDDEPPPLDNYLGEEEHANSKTGLFSGGQGLFDDSNESDDSLWANGVKKQSKSEKNTSSSKTSLAKKIPVQTATKGLFDESDSEDGLFSTNRIKGETQRTFLAPPSNPIAAPPDDEPPDLEEEDKSRKKPVGGISPFGNVNLFGEQNLGDILKNRKKDSVPNVESLQEHNKDVGNVMKPQQVETKQVEVTENKSSSSKQISLFDDDTDDLFKDDFLSSVATKKFSSNIFDSDSDEEFSSVPPTQKNVKQSLFEDNRRASLFDDDSATKQSLLEEKGADKQTSFDETLFKDEKQPALLKNDIKTSLVYREKQSNLESTLSETVNTSKSKEDQSLFDDDSMFNVKESKLFEQSPKQSSEQKSLFDDDDSLFGNKPGQDEESLFQGGEQLLFEGESADKKPLGAENKSFTNANKNKKLLVEDKKSAIEDSNEFLVGKNNDLLDLLHENVKPRVGENENKKSLVENNQSSVEDSKEFLVGNLGDDNDKPIFSKRLEDENQSLFPEDNDASRNKEDHQSLFEEDSSINAKKPKSSAQNTKQDSEEKPLFADEDSLLKSEDLLKISANTKSGTKSVDFHVDLFSSSPPPLDDEWDLNLDNNPEENVPYDFPTVETRSSLFDNEPPSLTLNETSGIDKDISHTSNQMNAFFEPPASSTRRFSADVNEQFSSDYCLTKNSLTQPPLDTITEPESTESIVNVTPSGDPDGLYEEDNVFSSPEVAKKDAENSSTKKDLPGKLTHNLNINVNALLPGAYRSSKSKSSNVPAAEEPDGKVSETQEENVQTLPSITKTRAKVLTKRRPPTRRGRQEQLLKSESDFKLPVNSGKQAQEELPAKTVNLGTIQVVHNITADNQNKVATSSIFDDDGDDLFSAKNVPPKKTEPKQVYEQPKTDKHSKLVAANNDNDNDLFAVTVTSSKQKAKKPKPQNKNNKSLFEDDNDDEDSLFANNNESSKKPNAKMFDGNGDGDDDDIFNKNVSRGAKKVVKKSLFDDDDSDDDIFGRASKQTVKAQKSTARPRASAENKKKNNLKTKTKTKTSNPIDDPLNALNN